LRCSAIQLKPSPGLLESLLQRAGEYLKLNFSYTLSKVLDPKLFACWLAGNCLKDARKLPLGFAAKAHRLAPSQRIKEILAGSIS